MSVEADLEHFTSASDKNSIRASMAYFGVIKEIWELDYNEFRVCMFKCQWVNGITSMHQDELGFTLVNLRKVANKDNPFIMAKQARHVFYIQDSCDSTWSVVLQGKSNSISHQNDTLTLHIGESPSFSPQMPSVNEEHEVDDVHAIHDDHDEGLWENILT